MFGDTIVAPSQVTPMVTSQKTCFFGDLHEPRQVSTWTAAQFDIASVFWVIIRDNVLGAIN
jgi:hypothetical protein